MWRGTHAGSYGGVPATGLPVDVRDSAIWHFRDGKVIEIFTLQDQFGLLKQIGYLPENVHAA
jgi:ketosteroid isomerase-like protein